MRMRLSPLLSTTLKQKKLSFFLPSHSTMHPCQQIPHHRMFQMPHVKLKESS